MESRVTHPVHKALHRPLTVCGVERKMFFLSLMAGGCTFQLFYSLLSGSLMFALIYGFAYWATLHDVEMIRILLSSSKFKSYYDAAKHERFDVEVL